MKILQIQTLNYLNVERFSAIPKDEKYDSNFIFSESYEPTLRKEVELALSDRGEEWKKMFKSGGNYKLRWTKKDNKTSHSIRHTCTLTFISNSGSKWTRSLSYSVYTLLA